MMKYKKIMMTLMVMAVSNYVFATSTEQMVLESQQTIKLFSQQLKKKLQQGVDEGGVEQAIEICLEAAAKIADQVSEKQGMSIGRTSLKVRNIRNMPDRWEKQVLQTFEQRKANGESIEKLDHAEIVTQGDAKFFRYMKAIPTQGLCLTCHGENIAEPVKEKLTVLYPEDSAIGFKAGDIRGAFTLIRPLD